MPFNSLTTRGEFRVDSQQVKTSIPFGSSRAPVGAICDYDTFSGHLLGLTRFQDLRVHMASERTHVTVGRTVRCQCSPMDSSVRWRPWLLGWRPSLLESEFPSREKTDDAFLEP